MIGVYIVGEDDVSRHVLYRILSYCGAGRFTVLMELPARGGEIKNKIQNFNQLAMKFPVILLTDLDADNCAPELKRKLLGGLEQAENLVFNVAVDEAEAWLMADRDGFAKYISVDVDQLPCAGLQKQGGAKACMEMQFSCKSSYFLTHILIRESSDQTLKKQLMAKGKASKGREYNTAILPFINECWDIESAMRNSDSLCRMVGRIKALL